MRNNTKISESNYNMTKLLTCLTVIFYRAMLCVDGDFIEPSPSMSLRSYIDAQTRLPCRFSVHEDVQVVQVTWSRQQPGGEREQIVIGHFIEGPKASPDFVNRVQFESPEPTVDSTLLILNTKKTDQAVYTCHITTYPSGNFERQISVTVWIPPISALEPVILQEGQAFRTAASCRSVGHPPPRLSWDTDVPGQSQNRTGEDGVVSAQFSLYPLRNMNGHHLDCLVWHPALDGPQRLQNKIIVHYPPDAVIEASGSWWLGQTGAELRCAVKGNPQPNITWSRKDGHLPGGVLVQGDKLVFSRPLNMMDYGTYVCHTSNTMGDVKSEFEVKLDGYTVIFLVIIIVSAAGGLVLILVTIFLFMNCNLRHKNRSLKRALSVQTEEMINLSRHVSMRRLNSINTDPRIQAEERSLIHMDGVMRHSVLSVGDQSTLSELKGQKLEYDSLGRPAIYTSYRPDRTSKKLSDEEFEERLRRVESYVQNSNMSVDSGLHRDQSSPHPSMSSGPAADVWNRGSRRQIHRQENEERDRNPEGEEGSAAVNSYLLSEAVNNYFHRSNGGLTPKANPNAIIINPRGPVH